MGNMKRRDFLKKAAVGGALLGASPLLSTPRSRPGPFPSWRYAKIQEGGKSDLIVAEKGEPAALAEAALAAFGGLEKIVKKDDFVVIKPNVAWARTPAQACNTNPELLGMVVKLCLQAGAGKVEVWEHSCDEFSLCFDLSGVKEAAEQAGARVFSGHLRGAYRTVALPQAKSLRETEILRSVLDCDVLINVPIVKVHYATGYTFSMKNFIGVNWNMSGVHRTPLGLHQGIADISTLIKPSLIVVDAVKVLANNGPKGPGKLLDVGQVVVGVDPVAVDAYCAGLMGRKPGDIPFIRLAHDQGLGEMNLNKIRTKAITA
jgi:uncharacterized protein (DUF362 family)